MRFVSACSALRTPLSIALLASVLPMTAHAIGGCTLDGNPIDLSNGSTTAGKTGMIHCTDRDGLPQRDIELRNGVQMGTMRYFQKGILQKEFTTNARGNQDGLSRTFAATPGPKNQVLREETRKNGDTVGVVRNWYPDGTLQRLGYRLDNGTEAAAAGFTAKGRLSDLRCFTQPVFAPDFDDATSCGFRKGPVTVDLYSPRELLAAHVAYDRGERRQIENLWENGKPQQVVELGTTAGTENDFTEDGVKRKSLAWVVQPGDGAGKPGRRVLTLQQDYHESGALIRERHWTPTDRGASLVLDESWYLNGQLKDKDDYFAQDGQPTKRSTTYHDNGKVATVGLWLTKGEDDDHEIGVHQSFDADGRLRGESIYDARGRATRERALDETGKVLRDDQVFEDGSRKAFAK